jgi:hypothetical protein
MVLFGCGGSLLYKWEPIGLWPFFGEIYENFPHR